MEKEKIINSYLDTKISNSLYLKTSNTFSLRMMERLKMELQFETEDKKADNVFKSIFFVILIAILSVTTIAIYTAFSIEPGIQNDSEHLNTFYELYNNFSLNFREIFNVIGDFNFLLLIPLVVIVFVTFNLIDKKFLNKNY